MRASRPRARRSGSTESRCASEPETPETFCTFSTVIGPRLRGRRRPSGRRSGRRRRARAAARPSSARSLRASARRARRAGRRGSPGSSRSKRSSCVEEPGEARVRGEHGQAGGGGLEDDLVRRAGPHVVDEHGGARVESGHLRERHGRRRSRRSPRPALELRPVGALLVGERRTADLEPTSTPRSRAIRTPSTIVRSPFAGEVRPSATASRPSRGPPQGNASTSTWWPIARTFGEASGNEPGSTVRTASETRSASRSSRLGRQCVNQSSSGTRAGRTSGAASTA